MNTSNISKSYSLNTPQPQISEPELKDSIAFVLGAERKKEISSADLTPLSRVNEEEMFAAIIHRRLKKDHPELAQKYEERLTKLIGRTKRNLGEASVLKASNKLLRGFYRRNKISEESYNEIKAYAFGKAQLDQDPTLLSKERVESSGDTSALRSLSNAINSFEVNQAATPEVMQDFDLKHLAPLKEIAQQKNIADPSPSAEVNASEEAISVDKSVLNGFVWKPVSEKDGKLVVLLPSSFIGKVAEVNIINPQGKEIAEGKYDGINNGFRPHFRFGNAGGSYPDGSILEIKMLEGGSFHYTVAETSNRID
ncbi:MAG: hypothetical protein H6619_04405 [Deltaproteobacteria bacterium]|nr:hypothetical protein [Deltaproteobacteria bacterium]